MIILTIFVLMFLSDNSSTISAIHLFLLFLLALRQLILLLVMANDYLMEYYLLSMKIVETLRISKYYHSQENSCSPSSCRENEYMKFVQVNQWWKRLQKIQFYWKLPCTHPEIHLSSDCVCANTYKYVSTNIFIPDMWWFLEKCNWYHCLWLAIRVLTKIPIWTLCTIFRLPHLMRDVFCVLTFKHLFANLLMF